MIHYQMEVLTTKKIIKDRRSTKPTMRMMMMLIQKKLIPRKKILKSYPMISKPFFFIC